MNVRTVGLVLFPGFEPLDAFGPVEVFAVAEAPGEPAAAAGGPPPGTPLFRVIAVAESRGEVPMRGGPRVVPDFDLGSCPRLDVLLVPGGVGTRLEVRNGALLEFLRARSAEAELTASVCTGAALLGAAGLLSGREATTNRRAFDWVVSVCPSDVRWNRRARWVDDGRVVTSAGISAGTDMALHLVQRLSHEEVALAAARRMEYRWDRGDA